MARLPNDGVHDSSELPASGAAEGGPDQYLPQDFDLLAPESHRAGEGSSERLAGHTRLSAARLAGGSIRRMGRDGGSDDGAVGPARGRNVTRRVGAAAARDVSAA